MITPYLYSNDARTNGISIGSILSDLIAEIVLASIDKSISENLIDIDFLAVRYKDDYRFLCQSEDQAKKILRVVCNHLVHGRIFAVLARNMLL